MADGTGIEWTDATWNPTVGCDKVSPGCDNCLDPETPVLYADGIWRPIKNVQVGDVLFAFQEDPAVGVNRILQTCVVEAAWKTKASTVTFHTASGLGVTCSTNHRWMVRATSSGRKRWERADALHLGTTLMRLGNPNTAADFNDLDYQAGYIAGVTAGDGSVRFTPQEIIPPMTKRRHGQTWWRVAILSDDQPVLTRLVKYLEAVGVNVEIRPFDGGSGGAMIPAETQRRPMSKVECRSETSLKIIEGLLAERNSNQYKAGWLAGFLDTDGASDGKSIRWSQAKENDYLERVVRYADDLGFRCNLEKAPKVGPLPAHYEGEKRPARTVRLAVNDLCERMDFVGTIAPALSRKGLDKNVGQLLTCQTDQVVSIAYSDERELIDIQTSTRTFIAAGLATHNCYAETFVNRFAGSKGFPLPFNQMLLRGDKFLNLPLTWKEPRKIFVNSLSDLFHKDVPDEFIANVFKTMEKCPQHTFQILTKRHGRMKSLLNSEKWKTLFPGGVLENVWLGVSVEDQERALLRIPALLDTPAAVRWISAEPLLGPFTLPDTTKRTDGATISWLVAGGESGPGARPMHEDWARSLRDQCSDADIPFLFKQWGSWKPALDGTDQAVDTDGNVYPGLYKNGNKKLNGRELDGKTHDGYPIPVKV